MIARAVGAAWVRRAGAVAATFAMAVGLAACGGGGESSTTSSSGGASDVLRYGIPAANVARGVSNPADIPHTGGPTLSIAYAPLFHVTPQGEIEPALAERWEYVDDQQRVFEFTLRDDARFSDGTPVTADAVVKWLQYYHDSENIYSALLGRDPRFRALDRWTVQISLSDPLPNLPLLFSEANVNWGFVASPRAVDDPRLFASRTYGAGPYMLDPDRTVPGDHYTFVPNPHFYDRSRIKFKELYLKTFADASAALQAQQAGQIDVNWSTDSSTADAAAKAGMDVVSAPFAVFYLTMNARRGTEALKDVRVRQALNYALDRDAISNALFGRYGRPTSQFTMPVDANPEMQDAYPYDPERARALLAEAGYPDGFTLRINTYKDNPQAKAVELASSYLERVGVTPRIRTHTTRPGYLESALGFRDDTAIFAANVGTPTTIEYPTYLGPDSTLGAGNPVDPRVYELYREGLRSRDPARYWRPMWATTVTDAWFMPLTTNSNMEYVSRSIGGVEMSERRPWSYPSEWYPK